VNTEPKPGQVYKHFKGGLYRILTVAVDVDNHSPVVVYTGSTGTWTRRMTEFMDTVSREDYEGPRFILTEEPLPDPAEELIKLRSFEAATRDTITWNVDSAAQAERLNALLERDATREERDLLAEVVLGLMQIDFREGALRIGRDTRGWWVYLFNIYKAQAQATLVLALRMADLIDMAEVVEKFTKVDLVKARTPLEPDLFA
jgi:hypothetical protein